MSDEKDFLEAVIRFGGEFLKRNPQLEDLVHTAQAGGMDPSEAVKEIWKASAQNPDFQKNVEEALFDAFKITPGSTDLAHFPDREKMLERWGFSDEDLVFQPFEDRPNYKMLHPLLMGMIVELLQFDGDIPELRTGRLPEGGSPAVPVKTVSRDPVFVGLLLKRASEEVAFELGAAKTEDDAKIEKMLGVLPEDAQGVTGLVRQETERGIAVPGYEPGKRAQMREVVAPSTAELSLVSFKDKQALAHKALASTQGRRSLAPVIASQIKAALTPVVSPQKVEVGVPREELPLKEVEWAIHIDGGKGEHNPNFNFIDIASRVLANKLMRYVQKNPLSTDGVLVVSPINQVSERRVGWTACLYKRRD